MRGAHRQCEEGSDAPIQGPRATPGLLRSARNADFNAERLRASTASLRKKVDYRAQPFGDLRISFYYPHNYRAESRRLGANTRRGYSRHSHYRPLAPFYQSCAVFFTFFLRLIFHPFL